MIEGASLHKFGVPGWAKVRKKLRDMDMDSTMTEDYDAEMESSLIESGFPQRYGFTDHETGILVLPFRYGLPVVSIFSNLHECKVLYLVNEYPSAEHAYKSMKAEMLNRCELLPQIMRQTSKQVQSVLSGMICREWEGVEVSVMGRLLFE